MHRRCGFDHLSDLGAKGTHMQKPAPNDAPIHELLRNRWSPRAFADQAIPQEVLRSLFEAARWAPSSFNEQPWAYIVATKEDKVNFEKVLGTDRKSTRLNSSHGYISYAVFCLKKKNKHMSNHIL